MQFKVSGTRLRVEWPHAAARSKVASSEFDAVVGVSVKVLNIIFQMLAVLTNGMSHQNTKTLVAALREIFRFIREGLGRWPETNEWALVIYNLYAHQLLAGGDDRTLDSSKAKWRDICQILQGCISKGVIPNLQLPEKSLPGRIRRQLKGNGVLGEEYISCVPAVISDPPLPKKFLCDLAFSKDEDAFFADIQEKLQVASEMVFEVNKAYWREMLRGHEVGKRLISSISRDDLLTALNDPQWHKPVKKAFHHIANPRSSKGIAYFLAAVDYYFFETDQLSSLSLREMERIPFLKPIVSIKQISRGIFGTLRAEMGATLGENADNLLCRALGVLSTRDCAAATAILMHEQPKFTPESVERADAYDQHGKILVSLPEESGKNILFTIIKARAKKRKGGLLSETASQVFLDVHVATRRLRAKAAREQSDVVGKLFLVATRHGFGHSGRVGRYFNGRGSVFELMQDYPGLAGMARSSFTLSKIRTTQGILVWLKTESVSAMAASLGNSVRVVLKNYIPDWLYRRMLIRSARRLQQKLILIATANKKHQLSSSDFSDSNEIDSFVRQVISLQEKGGPIWHAFRKAYPSFITSADGDLSGQLYLELSPESFAALEIYVKYGSGDLSGMEGVSVAAVQLYDLYDLLYSAMHGQLEGEVEPIIFSMIAGGSRAQLRMVWSRSRNLVDKYAQQIQQAHSGEEYE